MHRRRVSNVATFAFVVLFGLQAVPSAAQNAALPPRPAGRTARLAAAGPFVPVMRQLRGLQLSPEQRQQVLKIFQAHRQDIVAFRQRVKSARQAQPGTPLSPEARKQFAQERRQLMESVNKEVFGVLTPEQRQKVQARRRQR